MNKNSVKYLVVHHTGGTESNPLEDTSHHTFVQVNAWHRVDPDVWLGYYSSLGFAIGYHYFIDKKGKITQGREDKDEGAHCKGYNTQSLGICLAGNFDVTMPTKEQIDALTALLKAKKTEYSIPNEKIVPHRKFANKSCYGKHLSNDWLQQLLSEPIVSTPCTAVVEEQKRQIFNLRELVKSLIKLIK